MNIIYFCSHINEIVCALYSNWYEKYTDSKLQRWNSTHVWQSSAITIRINQTLLRAAINQAFNINIPSVTFWFSNHILFVNSCDWASSADTINVRTPIESLCSSGICKKFDVVLIKGEICVHIWVSLVSKDDALHSKRWMSWSSFQKLMWPSVSNFGCNTASSTTNETPNWSLVLVMRASMTQSYHCCCI